MTHWVQAAVHYPETLKEKTASATDSKGYLACQDKTRGVHDKSSMSWDENELASTLMLDTAAYFIVGVEVIMTGPAPCKISKS